jgi:hypothetical protein
MRGTLCRVAVSILAWAVVATPSGAQGVRTTLAVGATWLHFSLGDGGAVAAQLRLDKGAFELSTLAVAPLGGATAIPDCIPYAPCFERRTPDVLLGAAASLRKALGASAWRGSLGVGAVTAKGMKGPGRRSSAAGSIGLDWTPRHSGLTRTLGVRAFGLARSIGGMRYVIIPSIGFTF